MRYKDGKPNKLGETYDFKIILIYADRFVFYETDQGALFDRNAEPGKVIRTVPYDSISLGCGADANKMCSVGEFELMDPTFEAPPLIVDVAEYKRKCLVINIIDSTERKPSEELIYICYDGEALVNI